jgi:hypothetical protein
MSSFKGLDLFGSGPHRFAFGEQGYLLTLDFFGGGAGGGSTNQGPKETDIIVRGRLMASNESALWTLRNAIRAQFTDPAVAGTLVDSAGRSWTNMTLVTYREGDRRDRGRVYSMRYLVQFRNLD